MSIRLLLALTAAIACAIFVTRLFWFGNGIPGSTAPALLISEAAWFGMVVICFVVLEEDRKKRPPTLSDAVIALALLAMIAVQIAIPLKLLSEFGVSVAG